MTLRGQVLFLGLGLSFSLSVLLLLGLFIFETIMVPTIHDNVERKTTVALESLVAMDVELATNDLNAIKRKSEQMKIDKDLRYIGIRSVSGEPIFRFGTRPILDKQTHQKISFFDGVSFGSEDVVFEGLPLGQVEVAYSASQLEEVRSLVRLSYLIVSGLILFSIGVSVRFSKSVVTPVVAMATFAQEMKLGHLPEKLNDETGAQEVRLLAANLNTMAKTLEQRERLLRAQHKRLKDNLETIHNTREQLLSSTRLAAVGEMAGRTAHEVLNPVSSIHGRLTRISEEYAANEDKNISLLREIVESWRDDYAQGGFDTLIEGFKKPCVGHPETNLLQEDLDNFSAFIEFRKSANDTLRTDLTFLLKEVNRIVHIVDGMRGLAHSGGSKEHHSVKTLLVDSLDTLQDGLKKRQIRSSLSCDPAVAIYVDRYEFIQVVTNLVRNSMLAIEEDRGRKGGSVDIEVKTIAGDVLIRVHDDGPGIDEMNIQHIFESSFTTRNSSNGTGFGLAIARRLVRGFEGDLILEKSTVGEGATFRIEIPEAGTQYLDNSGRCDDQDGTKQHV